MKVTSPLLSFSASGSLADLITFLNIRGSTYAKTKQGKIGATSAAQLEQRAKFKAACVASHLLTDEQKLYYHNLDIRSASCSWFNNFLSTFLLEEEAPPVSFVESIQQVNFSILDTAKFDVVEINEVDLDSSIILIVGHCWTTDITRRIFTRVSFDDSTHVRAERNLGGTDCHSWVDCFVIHFGDGVVQSMQSLARHFLIDQNQFLVGVDEVDLSKSLIISQGTFTSDIGYIEDGVFSFPFSDSTHIWWYRKSWMSDVTSYVLIVEFK